MKAKWIISLFCVGCIALALVGCDSSVGSSGIFDTDEVELALESTLPPDLTYDIGSDWYVHERALNCEIYAIFDPETDNLGAGVSTFVSEVDDPDADIDIVVARHRFEEMGLTSNDKIVELNDVTTAKGWKCDFEVKESDGITNRQMYIVYENGYWYEFTWDTYPDKELSKEFARELPKIRDAFLRSIAIDGVPVFKE